MFEFAWPWVGLLIPLPLLVRLLAPTAVGGSHNALKVPFVERMQLAVGQSSADQGVSRVSLLLATLIWLLLLAAAAKPQWLGEPISQQREGRDLVLAIDLSQSMLEKDFQLNGELLNRLEATRLVAGDFIERRKGDRVGLILFAEQAYVQVPLTHDLNTVQRLLDEARVGLAGKSTAIGDAIGLAVKRFRKLESKQRILVLLTDGTNNAGELEPLQATQLASDDGVKIYTIGVAGEGQLRGPIGTLLANDYMAGTRPTPIDEQALIDIADQTGGRYFRARDLTQLAEIYEVLDQLEPVEQDDDFFRPVEPLFQWPLALALLLSLLLAALRRWQS